MKLNEMYENIVVFLEEKSKLIVKISISILVLIVLLIVLFFYMNSSVRKETKILLSNIESKQYSIALDYYKSLEKNLTHDKFNRFKKYSSKKINELILDKSDEYISENYSKEQFINLINTINSLNGVSIDQQSVDSKVKEIYNKYVNNKISYKLVNSYVSYISLLRKIDVNLDKYKDNIHTISQSRQVFDDGKKNMHDSKFKEAISDFNKVSKLDKNNYESAKKLKDKSIKKMYNYYFDEANRYNSQGDYKDALDTISYLKQFYPDDEDVLKLESKYEKNISMYDLSDDDLIDIISNKGNLEKDGLSIRSLPQMVNNVKYYYVELYKDDNLINEILINSINKKVYSYKYVNKNYKETYSDGYFMIDDTGAYNFSISDKYALKLLDTRLKLNKNDYKNDKIVDANEANEKIDSVNGIYKLFGNKKNIYYFVIVNKGFFKRKEVYAISFYGKKVYNITDGKLDEY